MTSDPDHKITIVFVDDEDKVLQALRRATRRWRDSWDTHFALGGVEALALFDELDRVDMVITDMRMPNMDGAELLTLVRERSPHTARIILSGQSDREAVLRAVGPAHQYLSKPVDIDELAQVVADVRSSSLTGLFDPVRALIGQADRLPSPPHLFQQLVAELESDGWTIDSVAEILSTDVALTAEMLKLVNSAFFGYFGEVNSVNRAVSLLGVDLVRTIVLGSKLFLADDRLESWLDLEQLDWRSKSVAHGARALASRDGASSETVAAAFLAGMVSEVGLLVMARVVGISASMAAPLNTSTFLDVERSLFGGDRFDVGCHLLRLWGFGANVVDAIVHLKDPDPEHVDGLAWYLFAARRLVLDGGLDPLQLAAPSGSIPEVDEALASVRRGELLTTERSESLV
jgi:HD-like signal output (HDOD) protein/CheY-like chemotaxis protein